MIKTFVLLSTLFWLSGSFTGQQGGEQVKHIILNDANLIETSRGYAINEPSLRQQNWATVSVNDDIVQIITPDCQQKNLSREQMQQSGQHQSLVNAKQMLNSVESGQMPWSSRPNERRAINSFSLDGSSQSSSMGVNIGQSAFNNGGVSFTIYNGQELTVSKRSPGFPGNINRIFIMGDTTTFIYNDERVRMKPTVCLEPSEQQLIHQVKAEAEETQQRFDASMRQFELDMQNMNQRLQRDMANMNHNLNNMFQNNNGLRRFQQNNGYDQMQQIYGGGSAAPNFYGAPQYSGNWPFNPMGANNPFGPSFPFR